MVAAVRRLPLLVAASSALIACAGPSPSALEQNEPPAATGYATFPPPPPTTTTEADTAEPASATPPPPTPDDTAPIAAPTTVAAPPPVTAVSPTTVAPPPTTPPAGRTFNVLVAGDLLSHIPVLDQALEYGAGSTYDFTPMFHAVAPLIASADLSICHLETPVAPPGTPPDPTPPDYGVPAQIVAGIAAAGFDRCSLASNHVMDKGAAGIDATLAAFDAAGLGHAGMARTPEEAGPQLFDVNGITIAHLSYTFSYNGMPVANGEPWRSNLIDVDRIVAEARQAREHGARFVILSVHWGAEGVTEVTGDQRQWAEQITASGAVDVIVGHHAHVVQPIEQVNGRWVVFGLGNFLSAMSASTECCGIRGQDGLLVRLTATEQPDGSFAVAPPQAIPTYVDRNDYVVLPVQSALADPVLAAGVGVPALGESLARTSRVVGNYVTG